MGFNLITRERLQDSVKNARGFVWKLAPFLTFQLPSIAFFEDTAPLFKEEGDSCGFALVTDVENPLWIHGPCSRARLATNDCPMNTF